MKKMKLVSMLLTLVMVVSMFAACGQAADNGSDSTDDNTAATEDAGGSDAAPAGDTAGVDPLEITFTTTFNETETGGLILKKFEEVLAEESGGAITVNFLWGGTAYDTMAELDAVADGSADMCALGHMPHIDVLNYLAFPGFAPGSPENATAYFEYLMFENEETSALIQGEAEALGIKYLNIVAGGANAFCTTYEFTDLDSMIAGSKSFGNMDAAIFEYLGFQVSAVGPGDTFTALDNGQIDSTQMGLAPMVSMGWYEVAKYWALDGTYTAGNPFTVNLAWWNGLTAAQQECIQTAADAAAEFSAESYTKDIEGDVQTVEEATGNAFVVLSDADIDRFWEACFEAKAASAIATAKENGKDEGMVTILKAAAEFTDYDWEVPAEYQ